MSRILVENFIKYIIKLEELFSDADFLILSFFFAIFLVHITHLHTDYFTVYPFILHIS